MSLAQWSDIRSELDGLGYDPSLIWSQASHIVLFGSRAADCAGARSDVDLLVVDSDLQSRYTREFDLIAKSIAEVSSPEWHTSELGSHIAKWGQALKGDLPRSCSPLSLRAAAGRKAEIVERRIATTTRFWSGLALPFQVRRVRRLCQDLIRLMLLKQDIPIPPTARLASYYREVEPQNRREALALVREPWLRQHVDEYILVEDQRWYHGWTPNREAAQQTDQD